MRLKRLATVRFFAQAAARLSETADAAIRDLAVDKQPYWHLERARIGDTRDLAVKAIVNSLPVARKTLHADGRIEDISVDLPIL